MVRLHRRGHLRRRQLGRRHLRRRHGRRDHGVLRHPGCLLEVRDVVLLLLLLCGGRGHLHLLRVLLLHRVQLLLLREVLLLRGLHRLLLCRELLLRRLHRLLLLLRRERLLLLQCLAMCVCLGADRLGRRRGLHRVRKRDWLARSGIHGHGLMRRVLLVLRGLLVGRGLVGLLRRHLDRAGRCMGRRGSWKPLALRGRWCRRLHFSGRSLSTPVGVSSTGSPRNVAARNIPTKTTEQRTRQEAKSSQP